MNAVLRDASLKYDLMLGDLPSPRKGAPRTSRHGAALLAVSAGVEQLGARLRKALSTSSSDSSSSTNGGVLPLDIAEHALAQAARRMSSATFLQKSNAGRSSGSGTM